MRSKHRTLNLNASNTVAKKISEVEHAFKTSTTLAALPQPARRHASRFFRLCGDLSLIQESPGTGETMHALI